MKEELKKLVLALNNARCQINSIRETAKHDWNNDIFSCNDIEIETLCDDTLKCMEDELWDMVMKMKTMTRICEGEE